MRRSKVLSLFSSFKRRLHKFLFVSSSDPHAPTWARAKHRTRLDNAVLIQVWAASLGIISILLAPLTIWLITLPYFVITYLCWCATVSIIWIVARHYIKKVNKSDEKKKLGNALENMQKYLY
jgi:hypothetical protein